MQWVVVCMGIVGTQRLAVKPAVEGFLALKVDTLTDAEIELCIAAAPSVARSVLCSSILLVVAMLDSTTGLAHPVGGGTPSATPPTC